MFKSKAMLDSMKKDVTEFFEDFKDDVNALSGWGHNYFCQEDGGKLIFDLKSPHRHICPICDYVYTSDKYNKTWTYLYRVRAVQEMLKSAYIFKATSEVRFLEYVKNTLEFYAKNYRLFELHVKEEISSDLNKDVGGAARIMPQGLNEAIALTKILLTLDILSGEFTDDYLSFIKDSLFKPAIDEVLAPQLNLVHNIKCWVNSAIGMAGIFFDELRWIELTFNGEYNINRQLREGVTADKFWYEGSIHYNFFTLEAIISLLLFCKKYNRPFGQEHDTPRKMLLAAYDYAFDNGVFPNPNDGWPNINLKTYLYIYKMAQDVYKNSELTAVTLAIEELDIERVAVPLWDAYHFQGIPLEALLSDQTAASKAHAPDKGSVLFPSSNYAILRCGETNLFLKYGHNGPSHAHPDKMTFELILGNDVITRDLSNAGYGAKVCNEWHRTSASHNTVVVDGKNHTNTEPGHVERFSENEIATKAQAYEDVTFERCIKLQNNKITDVFKVSGKNEHVFDYFLHIDGEICLDGVLVPAGLGFTENGYQHIKNINKVEGQREFLIKTKDKRCRINIDNGEIFLCNTLDNPVTKFRSTLIVRQKSNQAVFETVWHLLDGNNNA